MCEYCKYNNLDRNEFKKKIWENVIYPEAILDVANIGIYINNNRLVAIHFDNGVGIEQDEKEIKCCPICKEEFGQDKVLKYKKYDVNIVECRSKTPNEIIKEFNLSEGEIIVMKALYREQLDKQEISEDLYYDKEISDKYKTKAEFVKNTFGLLKKKGLIYSVIDFIGCIGTDIKV